MTNRNNSLDIVGGILVIYMILGHAFLWSHTQNHEIYLFLRRYLFFFMAFFFYKSGMFYTKKSVEDVISRGVHKFIYPFVVYMLMGEAVRCLRLYIQEGDINILHYIVYPFISIVGRGGPSGNVPLWFLLALFFTQCVVAVSDKYNVSRLKLLVGSFVVAIFYYLLKNKLPIPMPPCLIEIAMGVVFFVIGNLMKDKQNESRVLIVCIMIYTAIVIMMPSYYDFRKGSMSNGNLVMWVISSIAGIIVFNNFFKLKVFESFKMSLIGRYSMQFFCFHWVLFDLTCLVAGWQIEEDGQVFGNFFSKETNYMELVGLCLSSVIILPIYTYYVQKLKNRNNILAKYL